MDFLKAYDARSAAETPREMELRDQVTGEVITNNGKPCIVLVKGASSRTIQAALRNDEIARARKAQKASEDGEVDPNTMQDLHENTCKAAVRLIAGFKNMQSSGEDGKPRDLTADDAAAFCDLTFISMAHLLRDTIAPVRRPKEDVDAYQARLEAFKAWKKPSFAQQVLDFSNDDARFLEKPKKG